MPWEAQQNQWWDGNAGTAMIFADAPHFVLATGEGTIVSDDLESPLGRAFGEDQTRPTGFDADKGVLVDPGGL